MARSRRNLFYPLLGVVGFAFTITAASYCVSVLRGLRQETAGAEPHALQVLMDRHGTSILVGELVLLAIATVGAVGFDHVEGERLRAARDAEHRDDATGSGNGMGAS